MNIIIIFKNVMLLLNSKKVIGKINSLFAGFHASDAKDLLQFILGTKHSELKIAAQPFYRYLFDQTNEMQTWMHFYNSYITQNNSPIFKFLYGISQTEMTCSNCQKTSCISQSYNLLYFPLKEAKQMCNIKEKKGRSKFQ
jgi:ubiquitin C-terminal hydrolase